MFDIASTNSCDLGELSNLGELHLTPTTTQISHCYSLMTEKQSRLFKLPHGHSCCKFTAYIDSLYKAEMETRLLII